MEIFVATPRSFAGLYFAQSIHIAVKRWATLLIAVLILMFAGNAYAVPTVGLSIENGLDSNGDITVIDGSKVKVAYTVIQDTDKFLSKNDKIQLRRVIGNGVVDSVSRGKKKSGTVSLKVKNSEDEQLYVVYITKGKDGDLITRTSHPGDLGSIALLSIAKASVAGLTVRLNALETDRYAIGDIGPAGGWVFAVSEDGRHGLEVAPINIGAGRWDNGIMTDTEAHGDGVGAGKMNTMLIIANQGSDSNTYAAGLCANLVVTNAGIDYGDWYLPSKYELNLMYLNLHLPGLTPPANVQGFTNVLYWTSLESGTSGAWVQVFTTGNQTATNKASTGVSTRAIRAF